MSRVRISAPRGTKSRATGALAGAAAAAALLAPGAAAKTPTVTIKGDAIANYKFSPRKVEIKPRKTVDWEWDSNAAHNVTFTKPDKASKTAAKGSFSLKFRKKGTYRYICTIHGFGGKVVVG